MSTRIFSLFLLIALLCSLPIGTSAARNSRGALPLSATEALSSVASHDGADSLEDWVGTDLPARLRQGSGEWYVIALRGMGGFDLTSCAEAIGDYLRTSPALSAASEQKYALALLAAGATNDPYIDRVARENSTRQGIMSRIWGLILQGARGEEPDEALLTELLSLQGDHGGFALQSGRGADPDITAMAIQALSFYQGNDAVDAAIARALSCLSSLQKDSGGFATYGTENAESAAQVILAQSALNRNPISDEAFSKNGKTALDALLTYRTGGGFSHIIGGARIEMASAQAILALVAIERQANGEPFLFDFTAYPTEPTDSESLPASDSGTAPPPSQNATSSQTAPESNSPDSPTPGGDLRPYVAGGVLLLALLAIGLLAIKKRLSSGNLLLVIGIGAILLVLTLLTDIRTPEGYYGDVPTSSGGESVTVSIRCVPEVAAGIGLDGEYLLAPTVLPLDRGDTVYHALVKACRARRLTFDVTGSTAIPESIYIRGIASLYEFDHGEASGWTFTVNGERLYVGCGSAKLQNGDTVEWCYVTDLGGMGGEEA